MEAEGGGESPKTGQTSPKPNRISVANVKSHISGSTHDDEVVTKNPSMGNMLLGSNSNIFKFPQTVDTRNSVNLNSNLNQNSTQRDKAKVEEEKKPPVALAGGTKNLFENFFK